MPRTRPRDLRVVEGELKVLEGRTEEIDTRRRFQKADLDSKRSLYDGMIDRGEERAGTGLLEHGRPAGREGARRPFRMELEKDKAKLDREESREGEAAGLRRRPQEREGAADARGGSRARVIEQKDALYGGPLHWYSKPMAFLRSLPGIDIMPPTKIQQLSLPELTINYNFKEVPRYDRCGTCHQGIDRIGYDKDAHGEEMPRCSGRTRS